MLWVENYQTIIRIFDVRYFKYLQHPKGIFVEMFFQDAKIFDNLQKNNDSGKNCRLGHLPKMPKVTIYLFSAFPKNQMQSGRTRIAANASLLF